MTLTLLALFMLPMAFKMVLDPRGMYKTLKEWEDSRALQLMSSILPLMLALLIFATADIQFAWNWDSLLTWLAVLIAVKGISHLFPAVVEWKMGFINEQRLPVFGFLALLFALALVYVDAQVL